jgi:DNA-binding IscR family transcriptional regulator
MLSKKTQCIKSTYIFSRKKTTVPVLISEISKKKNPFKIFRKYFIRAEKSEILESKKGKGGGYFFAQDPKKVPIAKVMRLIDGQLHCCHVLV